MIWSYSKWSRLTSENKGLYYYFSIFLRFNTDVTELSTVQLAMQKQTDNLFYKKKDIFLAPTNHRDKSKLPEKWR